MNFSIHHAATIAEIDPALMDPETTEGICQFALWSVERAAQIVLPTSDLEAQCEKWADEIETIKASCQSPTIVAAWKQERHGHEIHRRLAEIEQECYSKLLANLEYLEPDNPMWALVHHYQQARTAKAETDAPSYFIREG